MGSIIEYKYLEQEYVRNTTLSLFKRYPSAID